MYYRTRLHRRADAVRAIYGCLGSIHIFESVAHVSDNVDNPYKIWVGKGKLIKIVPKVLDYMQFNDGGWIYAFDMVQIKRADIRINPLHVERIFPVDCKEMGISRSFRKIEIPDMEYWFLTGLTSSRNYY